jgi:hypothetical protein
MRTPLERLAARREELVRRSCAHRNAIATAAAQLRPVVAVPALAVRAWATYAIVRRLLGR